VSVRTRVGKEKVRSHGKERVRSRGRAWDTSMTRMSIVASSVHAPNVRMTYGCDNLRTTPGSVHDGRRSIRVNWQTPGLGNHASLVGLGKYHES